MRRRIAKQRIKDQSESSGRGQSSRRWRAIRARIRGKHGQRPTNQNKDTISRSAISEAFKQAKERRYKGAQNAGSRTRYVKEEGGDTHGWNEEDHETFIEEAKKNEWEIDGRFLDRVQVRMPYMLHSEIIDHRRWVRGQYGSSSEERRNASANKEAEESEKNKDTESGTDDEEEVTNRFGVLTAKAREDYTADVR